VLEKGGGAVRKPADLESILGPVPAQPAMSAFSFAVPDAPPPAPPRPPLPSGPGAGAPSGPSLPGLAAGRPAPPAPRPPGSSPMVPPGSPQSPPAPPAQSSPALPGLGAGFPTNQGSSPALVSPLAPSATAPSRPGGGPSSPGETPASDASPKAGPPAVKGAPPPPPRVPASTMLGIGQNASGGGAAGHARAPALARPPTGSGPITSLPNDASPAARPPAPSRPQVSAGAVPASPGSTGSLPRSVRELPDDGDDEATVVAQAPSDLLARSASEPKSHPDSAEWMAVYDDFVRTKKQCGEATEGLTFEKFQTTLKKNRDALMQRHNCKRVRFSVYVKDGRASLKATPVRD
jgi:hypothetical protein